MKKGIKNTILTSLAGILISGCSNLPNIYRNNLTANSKIYKSQAINTIIRSENFEEKARLEYVVNNIKLKNENFSINSFQDKNEKIAYCKWKAENPKEVIIYLNGLESHSGWFDESAKELGKKEITIYCLDRRGSGINTRIKGGSKDWLRDIDRIIEIAKDENPNLDMNLASLCFGARLSTAYAIENPNKIDSLIYISPGFNMKVRPKGLEPLSIALDCFGIQTNTQSPIKNDEMFTSNPKYLEFLRQDKLRTRAPNSDAYIKGQSLLKNSIKNLDKIQIPSLVLLASSDDIINIEKTKKTLEKFGKKPKIIEYSSEHAIFFEESKKQLTKDIIDFISQ